MEIKISVNGSVLNCPYSYSHFLNSAVTTIKTVDDITIVDFRKLTDPAQIIAELGVNVMVFKKMCSSFFLLLQRNILTRNACSVFLNFALIIK